VAEQYTTRAHEAIQKAHSFAQDRGNPSLEIEHLMAALLEDAEGIVPRILEAIGVPAGELRKAFAEALSRFPQASGGDVRMSADLAKALREAEKIAKSMKDEYTSVEHLLLGIVEGVPSSNAAKLLGRLGVNAAKLREAIKKATGGTS
jgi:ATP-dependent Clp protease ATP-binding subunit ClpB